MEIIQKLITRKGPGHLFRLAHFILALKVIEEKGPIGRYELGRILDLGGGSIRTLVTRLKNAELIEAEGNKGHIIASQGARVLEEIHGILITMKSLDGAAQLTNGNYNIACHVRGVSSKIGTGISLRDAAISIGAKSIISIVYKGNYQLEIPMLKENYLVEEHPILHKTLLTEFLFETGDVIIICGADTEIIAKLGAITAILSLLNS